MLSNQNQKFVLSNGFGTPVISNGSILSNGILLGSSTTVPTLYATQPSAATYIQPATIQVPMETREVKQVRPKVSYDSKYIPVPKTTQVPQTIKERRLVTVDKEIWETKMVPIQVKRIVQVQEEREFDKEILVPKVVTEEREIRIPKPVMETRTVRVPKQRIVTEEEEHTYEVPAMEEYTTTVSVPIQYTNVPAARPVVTSPVTSYVIHPIAGAALKSAATTYTSAGPSLYSTVPSPFSYIAQAPK